MNPRDLLPFDLGSGTYLGNGIADRGVNLNDAYINPTIKNPKYDSTGPEFQYEDDPEGLIYDHKRGQYVKKGAPTGLWGGLMGAADWLIPGSGTDWDRAGETSPYGVPAAPGTVGGQRVQIKPRIENPEYPGDASDPNAVPKVNQAKWFRDQVAISEWNRARSRADMRYGLDQSSKYLKDANYYAYQLDKAQMYDYMNSPRGQAETSLTQQQALATPRFAKAALIEARAKSQQAANEFGELGLQRTYAPGIG